MHFKNQLTEGMSLNWGREILAGRSGHRWDLSSSYLAFLVLSSCVSRWRIDEGSKLSAVVCGCPFVWAKPIIEKLKDMNRRGAFSQYLALSRQTPSLWDTAFRCSSSMPSGMLTRWRCWSSQGASGQGRKEVEVTVNVLKTWLLVPDGPVWVFHKVLLIYWAFCSDTIICRIYSEWSRKQEKSQRVAVVRKSAAYWWQPSEVIMGRHAKTNHFQKYILTRGY